ncbi:DsbA family protein [Acidimangrovimonas pyrenivorans]|uniref:DsbA family protein n=1 Tax=Acidimangrovimonas pyrenivorans TaxID=2030798 RepID=A0ABV7AH88_9RHOB
MPNRRKFLALGGTAVALGGLWWANARTGGIDAGQSLLPGAANAQESTPAPAGDLPKVPDYILGNPDAKVEVIEYASFTCPHCAEFHADVWPELKKNYVDTNKIKFIMREVYFDKYGLWAGMVARCGGEMRYYGITDILFDTQREWAGSNDPNKVVDNLKKIGLKSGLTKDQLDQCLNDGKMAQAMVAKYQKDSSKDKVPGTPSFVINGTLYKNMGYGEFSKILDGLLKS